MIETRLRYTQSDPAAFLLPNGAQTVSPFCQVVLLEYLKALQEQTSEAAAPVVNEYLYAGELFRCIMKWNANIQASRSIGEGVFR